MTIGRENTAGFALASRDGIGGGRDHHELRPGVDGAPEGLEPSLQQPGGGADRHGAVVRVHRGRAETGEVLRRRGDAGRLQSPDEGRREGADDRRILPEGAAAEEALRRRERVGDRGEVDVDARTAQRGRSGCRLLLDLRRVVEPSERGGGVERRRPRQAPHDPALLVDADEERLAGAARGRLQLPRHRRHRGARRPVADEDHPAELARAHAREKRRARRPRQRAHHRLAGQPRERDRPAARRGGGRRARSRARERQHGCGPL